MMNITQNKTNTKNLRICHVKYWTTKECKTWESARVWNFFKGKQHEVFYINYYVTETEPTIKLPAYAYAWDGPLSSRSRKELR